MREVRRLTTELGDTTVAVVVCDRCAAATPSMDPGEGWVHVESLNVASGRTTPPLRGDFCSLEHALAAGLDEASKEPKKLEGILKAVKK